MSCWRMTRPRRPPRVTPTQFCCRLQTVRMSCHAVPPLAASAWAISHRFLTYYTQRHFRSSTRTEVLRSSNSIRPSRPCGMQTRLHIHVPYPRTADHRVSRRFALAIRPTVPISCTIGALSRCLSSVAAPIAPTPPLCRRWPERPLRTRRCAQRWRSSRRRSRTRTTSSARRSK